MKRVSLEQLEQQRQQVVALHREGRRVMEIVRLSGLSYPTVRATVDRYLAEGEASIAPAPRGRKAGEGRILTAEHEHALQRVLQQETPADYGLQDASWTRAAVARLIEQQYGLVISARSVANYLKRWQVAPDVRGEGEPPAPASPADGYEPVDRYEWGPRIHRQPGTAQTLAGQIAQHLRRDIITHRFTAGERLTFDKLSRAYEVGSSPLREALFQVVGEGLVQAEEHKGFVVAPINRREMLDISSLRANLEAIALRQSIERGDDEWEGRVLSANHRLKKATRQVSQAEGPQQLQATEEWEMRHRQLHSVLCSACGSPWLLHFIDILYEHLERYRRYFWVYRTRAQGADQEHEQIVGAALARDTERAIQLLQSHFQTQAELSLALEQDDAGRRATAARRTGSKGTSSPRR